MAASGDSDCLVVIEGLVDSIPVTPAESFLAFLPHPGMRVTQLDRFERRGHGRRFPGECQDQSVEEQVA